jgi:pyruvate kinase
VVSTAEAHSLASIPRIARRPETRQEAIANAAIRIAEDLGAAAIAAFTETGSTARRMASHRHGVPLLAFTSRDETRSQLALQWGVETFVVPRMAHTDEMIAQVDRAMLELGRARPGDLVVIVAGTPPGTVGSTNTLRVHRLGGQ